MSTVGEYFMAYLNGETSLEETCDKAVAFIDKVILEHTFTCQICGRVIPPKVFYVGEGLCIESDRAEIRGGLKNKILKKDICNECYKKLTLNI